MREGGNPLLNTSNYYRNGRLLPWI